MLYPMEDRGAEPLATDQRRGLLVLLTMLALAQIGHLLDGMRHSSASTLQVLANARALLGVTAAVVAFVAVARRWRHANTITLGVALATAVGFVLYHGLPVHLGANHPYWGTRAHADVVEWLTVAAIVAIAVSTACVA